MPDSHPIGKSTAGSNGLESSLDHRAPREFPCTLPKRLQRAAKTFIATEDNLHLGKLALLEMLGHAIDVQNEGSFPDIEINRMIPMKKIELLQDSIDST